MITVLGAEVPDGSALTSWITGLAKHWFFGQGYVCDPGPLPPELLGVTFWGLEYWP